MSPRRSRLRDIAAEARLIDADLERERIRAARDSANVATGVGALRDLVPGIAGIYGDVVKRDEDKKATKEKTAEELAERLRVESRADKQTADERAYKDRVRGEDAKRADAAKAAERERAEAKAKADREYEIDKDSAKFNQEGFKQQDTRTKNETDAAIEREKLAAKGKGGTRALTVKEQLDIDAKKLDIAKKKQDIEKQKNEPVEKKKAQVQEVDNYVADIEDNIKAIEKQIDESGTFELTGSHDRDLERRITNIATGMAKLIDPGSVAREGEVALAKKGLIPTDGIGALFTNNNTAKQILKNLRGEVEQRRRRAYEVRGLGEPGADEDVDAFNAAFGGQ